MFCVISVGGGGGGVCRCWGLPVVLVLVVGVVVAVVVFVVVVDFLAGSGLEDAPRLKSLPSVALRLLRPLPLPCREYTHSLEVRIHRSQPSRRPPHLCCVRGTVISLLI